MCSAIRRRMKSCGMIFAEPADRAGFCARRATSASISSRVRRSPVREHPPRVKPCCASRRRMPGGNCTEDGCRCRCFLSAPSMRRRACIPESPRRLPRCGRERCRAPHRRLLRRTFPKARHSPSRRFPRPPCRFRSPRAARRANSFTKLLEPDLENRLRALLLGRNDDVSARRLPRLPPREMKVHAEARSTEVRRVPVHSPGIAQSRPLCSPRLAVGIANCIVTFHEFVNLRADFFDRRQRPFHQCGIVRARDVGHREAGDRRVEIEETGFRDHRGDLGAETAGHQVLMHDQAAPRALDRSNHRLAVPRHQGAQVDDLDRSDRRRPLRSARPSRPR